MNKLSKFTLIVALSVATVSCEKSDEFNDNLGTGIRSEL